MKFNFGGVNLIKFLNNFEKNKTRKIWEKIFLEDSKNFLDYYYSKKTKNNHILAKYLNSEIVSMLHLNPFKIYMNNEIFQTYYIVAVATLENHRKKGYMQNILNYSLNFMYNQKIPFCFLRPAKKEIYLPFDFKYIYNHKNISLNVHNLKEVKLSHNHYKSLSNFFETYLKQKYNVFTVRDTEYIKLLHNEVLSENGDIILLYENNNLLGCYIYWGNNEKIIRGVFIEEKYCNILNIKPLVMGRIININEFFKNITSKNSSISLILNIKDNIIKENNGVFKLDINNKFSIINKITEKNFNDILNISIGDLTSLFFGYENISNFTKNENIINLFQNINLYNPFLDEEV